MEALELWQRVLQEKTCLAGIGNKLRGDGRLLALISIELMKEKETYSEKGKGHPFATYYWKQV